MPVKRDFGLHIDRLDPAVRGRLIAYINIKLAGLGLPIYSREGTTFVELASDMLENMREKNRLLADYLPPSDRRIQAFIDSYLAGAGLARFPRIPSNTLVLDRYGMARELSLPPDAHKHVSPTITSYRVRNGVLHNPSNDRRTTEGVFHVAEGGLPVPPDKRAVPAAVFGRLLDAAFNPPSDLLELPFTSKEEEKARGFISLLLRPVVRPEVSGYCEERSTEIRFFAPGSLAASLDFIESIFGNSGDPYIAENDAALDPLHWSGTTGCIVLATHLTRMKKKELGLPSWDKATDRQKRDGMAYKDEGEPYNGGKPFKLCARDDRGIMISIIADNYFGYSKKEVKAHISYAANVVGLAEEEHSGGALVFPSYNLGQRFVPDTNLKSHGHSLDGVVEIMGPRVELKPEGYAIDLTFPQVIYLPEDAVISLEDQCARWRWEGEERSLRVLPGEHYVHPTGYTVRMDRHLGSGAWRLVGTAAEGLLCHKPCTVSGGGKSEIAKSISDAIVFSPLIIGDYEADMAAVKAIIERNYGDRFKDPAENHGDASRKILSPGRSLGSVIKLLSVSPLNTDEFNAWLLSQPERIKALVFLVKRFYRPEWGDDWSRMYTVDKVNGTTGNILKFDGRPILGSYLRVGRDPSGMNRTFKLRQDFLPADKLQWEDDITASTVVPASRLADLPNWVDPAMSLKFCRNVEARFFQRPDDAVIRGYDEQAEKDLSRRDNFISNFEPLPKSKAAEMVEKTVRFSEYTPHMRAFIESVEADAACEWFVASDRLRIVDGSPTKNPRYLQLDPNYTRPVERYLADLGPRLYRRVKADRPILHPVGATLPGRRNNPADYDAGIRPLAIYGPIHFQDLPELFMDFICSLTGKSPSTTGAGSEGALTKGPFNALVPTTDLNNALLSFILTGYPGFTTAAGYIGRKYKVDHDVSLLVPELWSRLLPEERDPEFMKARGYLERIEDFEFEGKRIPASRLGWRITSLFAATYLGRIFDNPTSVFSDDILRPELQSLPEFADGVLNIAEAQAKVAKDYLADGSVAAAIPPLAAILHIMAEGNWEGKTAADPEVRKLFEREYVLSSDWYRERLELFQAHEMAYLDASAAYLRAFLVERSEAGSLLIRRAQAELGRVEDKKSAMKQKAYAESLVGTIGLDPLFRG